MAFPDPIPDDIIKRLSELSSALQERSIALQRQAQAASRDLRRHLEAARFEMPVPRPDGEAPLPVPPSAQSPSEAPSRGTTHAVPSTKLPGSQS